MLPKIKFLVVLALIILVQACGPRNVPPAEQKTPLEIAQEQAATWLHIWNQQYRDHKYMSQMPNLTSAQMTVLNKKADLLDTSKPLLDAYVRTVKGGTLPSTVDEQSLMRLMNDLSGMALQYTK